MRTLEQALYDRELVALRIMGEWYDLELHGADKQTCVQALAETMKELDLLHELNFLPPEEAEALQALVSAGGRMPVGTFMREHGEVRQMGPARMEREEPWYDPVSPAEALWYRGFLHMGYDETDVAEGLVEYVYLPQEWLDQFPAPSSVSRPEASDQPIAAVELPTEPAASTSWVVDDLATILGFAQQQGVDKERVDELNPYLCDSQPVRLSLLVRLAQELEFMRDSGGLLRPSRKAVSWLRQGRDAQMAVLADAWTSSSWNDLCHTPDLACEGSGWSNEPISARTAILDALPRTKDWYSTSSIIAHIKESNPDFQRPEGNYDTWYVRDLERGEYVRGFENWEFVEGRLLRFLIEGPMFWLGLTDTGEDCYRLTTRALAWLEGRPQSSGEVDVPIVVQPDATVLVPYNASRQHRFQVARVADLEPLEMGKPYAYCLTPASLGRARDAGISPDRVLSFLEEASSRPIPTSVSRAVARWTENGVEGRLGELVVLRVRDARILDTLQNDPRTRPFLGERLGDLAIVVQGENWRELRRVTAQLGLLLGLND